MSKNLSKQQPKAVKENDNKDLLRFEFEVLLEEYRVTSAQVLNRLDADDKGLELGLVAVGIAVAAAAMAVDNKMYVLLLALSIPFHVLIWGQVRRVDTGRRLVEYITKIVAPRLDTIIRNTSALPSKYGKPVEFISWEGFMSSRVKSHLPTYLAVALSQAGRASVHLSATIVLPTAYITFRQIDPQYYVSPFDTPLLVVNIILVALSVLMLLSTFFGARKHL